VRAIEMGRDAETPELNKAILTKPVSSGLISMFKRTVFTIRLNRAQCSR
jgi:hypothetical protein